MTKRRVSLVSALLTAVLVPLVATAFVLSLTTFFASRRSINELSSSLMNQSMLALTERVGRMMDQCTASVDELAPGLKTVSAADFEPMLSRFESDLRGKADLTYISYGLEATGDYAHVYRRPDGRIERQQSSVNGWREDYFWSGQRTGVRRAKTNYDPRKRPYYRLAKAQMRPVWTPIYQFLSPDGQTELGVTFAVPVLNSEGRLAGVMSVDVSLVSLSAYLRSFSLAESGYGMIVDRSQADKRAIVAHPTRSLLGTDLMKNPKLRAMPQDGATGDFGFSHQGKEFLASVSALQGKRTPDWALYAIVPEDELLDKIRDAERKSLVAGLTAVIGSALLGWMISRRVTKPLQAITRETERIRALELDSGADLETSISEIATLNAAVRDLKSSIRSFEKFVPGSYVRQLIESGEEARISGEKVVVTASFTDIAGFTSMSEHLQPEDAVMLLSVYLSTLTDCIQAEGGTVDKYIGDEVLAFWRGEDHAVKAIRAALACQRAFAALAIDLEQPLRIRVGLSTGEAVVGTMGSPERLNYTVIGDTINLGKRLEAICDAQGAKILVNEATFELAKEEFDWRFVAEVEVKGRTQSVRVYEPLALRGEKPGVH